MIDSSAIYGLYNPAFTDDIGTSMVTRISGNSIRDLDDYKLGGITHSIDNLDIKRTLPQDKVELSTSSKKKKILVGTAIGVAAIIAGLAAWKFGGLTKLKTLGSKIIPSGAGIKSFFSKMWNGVKAIPSKIKGLFK